MNSSAYTLFYAVVLGGLCAFGITAASNYTEGARTANEQADKALCVMRLLGVELKDGITAEEAMTKYEKCVEETTCVGYTAFKSLDANIKTMVLDVAGTGYNGTMKALLAFNPSEQKLMDILFYKHDETPGLGKDMEKEPFRVQFKGMPYAKDGKLIKTEMVKCMGDAKAPNQFDAITAATFTSIGVEEIINEVTTKLIEGGK